MAEKNKAPVSARAAGSDEKAKALETALAQIKKQYGEGAVMRLGQDSALNVEAVPTGSLSLDLALGIGGLPRGRIVEIYGPESSGKTTPGPALHRRGTEDGGQRRLYRRGTRPGPCVRRAPGGGCGQPAGEPAGHRRAGFGDHRGAGALQRHRRDCHRLCGGPGAPGGDRRGIWETPTWACRPG